MANFNMLYKALPGNILGMPDDALGPTKTVFARPGGAYSTHLNARDDKRIYPLLVPNQVEVDALLYGRPPTPEQHERARTYADAHPEATIPLPEGMKGDSPEAEAFEQAWHVKEAQKGKASQKFLDLLSGTGVRQDSEE